MDSWKWVGRGSDMKDKWGWASGAGATPAPGCLRKEIGEGRGGGEPGGKRKRRRRRKVEENEEGQ